MQEKRVMVTGEKETFLVRVVIKKLQSAGINCDFVSWDVDDINSKWEGTSLVILYMDEGGHPKEKVLYYLIEKMEEEGKRVILIGERNDISFACDYIPRKLIYKNFVRPLDNEEFLKTVQDVLLKLDSDEFRKCILVVDDDPGYLGLVREWLKDTYKVAPVSSGLQAIRWLGKNKADLILLDHEMPVTTGPQVLEMLRSDEETRKIPVIFLTGKSDKESVMEVVSLKPEGYFLKNITKEELLNNLENFFIMHR